jgi:hypothetical protein
MKLRKILQCEINENPCSGGRVIPCGRTGRRADKERDVEKLIVSFRNFANVPKNKHWWKAPHFFCECGEVDRKENVLDYINFIGADRETVWGSSGRDKVNVNTE